MEVDRIFIRFVAFKLATGSPSAGVDRAQTRGYSPLATTTRVQVGVSGGQSEHIPKSLLSSFAFGFHTQIIVQLVRRGSRGVALVSQLCPDLSQRWQTSLQLESYNRNIYMTVSSQRAATSAISWPRACVTAYRTGCEVTNTCRIQCYVVVSLAAFCNTLWGKHY